MEINMFEGCNQAYIYISTFGNVIKTHIEKRQQKCHQKKRHFLVYRGRSPKKIFDLRSNEFSDMSVDHWEYPGIDIRGLHTLPVLRKRFYLLAS